MKFQVSMETKVTEWVEVEAETAEDAVLIAKRDHSKVERKISLDVTWVDEAERAEEMGELSIEYEGVCDNCGYPLLRRHYQDYSTGERDKHPKGWPWVHDTPSQAQVGPDKNRDYFTWCYGCLQSPLRQLADCAEE